MQELIDKITEIVAVNGLNVLWALVIFVVGKAVAKGVANMVRKLLKKREMDDVLVSFVGTMVYALLIAFVAIAALNRLGINTMSAVAVLGAMGIAVGFALQGSLSNFASGVLLIILRPFKAGDFVEAGGATGVVEEVEIFATIIRSGDNKKIIVPNSAIMGGTLTNYSAKPTRRVDMVIGVGYGDDLKLVRAEIEDLLNADERVLKDPEPTIGVCELGDSSVNFAVRPWVKSEDYWAVMFDFLEAVKIRFDEKGISIPYPQQDVHMHQVASND